MRKPRFAAILAPFLVAGCSTAVETRISSSGVATTEAQPIMLSDDPQASPELRSAYALVASDLAKRGYVFDKEPVLHLAVTVDARDAGLALASGSLNLSAAKKTKPFQSCADKEYRVGVTITRIADGAEIYRGRAAEYHCKVPVGDALPTLVTAALADLGQPRGSYVVKRTARE